MSWKEKLRSDPDLAVIAIEVLKSEIDQLKMRVDILESALKKIKSLVWEWTDDTPTPAQYMRKIAREALK